MTLCGIDGKGTFDFDALIAECLCEAALQVFLRGPADLVRRLAKVSAGDENNLFQR
jgi:hypothetical protein